MAAHRTWIAALTVVAVLGAASCGDEATAPAVPAPVGPVEPDFSLRDENPASATAGQMVSPRQHLGHISAWYFGHST